MSGSLSRRAYPLPPEVSADRNPTALIDQMAQQFPRCGYPELSTGDLGRLAAAVRGFLDGTRTQVDDRLHVDPAPDQCPRCFGRHGEDPGIHEHEDSDGRAYFECVPCDRRFGAHPAGPEVAV